MKPGPFLAISILLVIFCAASFLMFHVAGTMAHLLLLLAVLFLAGHLVGDTTTT